MTHAGPRGCYVLCALVQPNVLVIVIAPVYVAGFVGLDGMVNVSGLPVND